MMKFIETFEKEDLSYEETRRGLSSIRKITRKQESIYYLILRLQRFYLTDYSRELGICDQSPELRRRLLGLYNPRKTMEIIDLITIRDSNITKNQIDHI